MNAKATLAAAQAALDFNVADGHSEEGAVDISGTFTATLVVEGTVDGTNYRALAMTPVGGGASVASVTAPGMWRVDLGGWKAARVRVSAFTSGSAVVAVGTTRKAA